MHFEHHGYFETLHDVRLNRTLGTRNLETLPPDRKVGQAGAIEIDLTEPVYLKRGIKTARFSASASNPRRVESTINYVCGRMVTKTI